MALRLVTGPTETPLDINEVKAHLRVEDDVNDEDALILSYLNAAISYLDGRDGILGRCLVTQTWDYALDDFPRGRKAIRLPLAPVQSITSITYTDTDGAEQTFASSKYSLSSDTHWRPRVDLDYDDSWPGTRNIKDAVTVRFVAGYGDANSVPQTIKQAMLLMIAHWHEHRESVDIGASASEVPMSSTFLLAPYRRGLF